MQILECVPNISEGRNDQTIAAVADAIRSVAGVRLLHQTSDVDHNRTVYTFVGSPEDVADAAFVMVKTAVKLINLRQHVGVHPRLGAVDVLPLVPVRNAGLDEAASWARTLGERISSELGIPVFFYGAAARRPETVRLEAVRKLALEGLEPDLGPWQIDGSAGACCVGARDYLIAWNINLETADLSLAQRIAREIRESNGGFRGLKALGMPLKSRGQVQISMNLVDFRATPLHVVFERVAAMCRDFDIAVVGSELIGLVPQAALNLSDGHDLRWLNLEPGSVLENKLPRDTIEI